MQTSTDRVIGNIFDNMDRKRDMADICLNIQRTFDRVWPDGLMVKNHIKVIPSFLSDRVTTNKDLANNSPKLS